MYAINQKAETTLFILLKVLHYFYISITSVLEVKGGRGAMLSVFMKKEEPESMLFQFIFILNYWKKTTKVCILNSNFVTSIFHKVYKLFFAQWIIL